MIFWLLRFLFNAIALGFWTETTWILLILLQYWLDLLLWLQDSWTSNRVLLISFSSTHNLLLLFSFICWRLLVLNLLLQNHLNRLHHLNVIILNATYRLRYNLSTIFNIVNLYLNWRGIRLNDITWMDTNLGCVTLSINFCSNSRGISYYEVIDIVFCNNVSYMLCWCWLTQLLLKLLSPSLSFRLILLIIIVLRLISIFWPWNTVIAFLIFIENLVGCHDIFNFNLIIRRDHISIFFLFLF